MPSICKSSEPLISPLICRLEPSRAEERDGEITDFSDGVCCLDHSSHSSSITSQKNMIGPTLKTKEDLYCRFKLRPEATEKSFAFA